MTGASLSVVCALCSALLGLSAAAPASAQSLEIVKTFEFGLVTGLDRGVVTAVGRLRAVKWAARVRTTNVFRPVQIDSPRQNRSKAARNPPETTPNSA